MGSMLDAINLTDIHKESFNLTRHPNKNCQLHTCKLVNDMQIVLIHDPDVTMSAATMHVNVGSMDDPPYMPGMAHLVEHALFLGTKEYQLYVFNYWLKMYGGLTNASTYPFETIYQFEVMHDGLAAALKMFASMFICPLLNDRVAM